VIAVRVPLLVAWRVAIGLIALTGAIRPVICTRTAQWRQPVQCDRGESDKAQPWLADDSGDDNIDER